MAIFGARGRRGGVGEGVEHPGLTAHRAAGGGVFASATALVALCLSAYSVYESVLKQDRLRVFAGPTLAYADTAQGPFDMYEIPLTIANTGARTGVALAMDLLVEDPATGEAKRYYAAELGVWRDGYNGAATAFAPVSVPGREARSVTVLFYPRADETVDRLVKIEPTTYRYTLTLTPARVERLPQPLEGAPEPVTLVFERVSPGIDYRAFNNGGTIAFRSPDYAPSASE